MKAMLKVFLVLSLLACLALVFAGCGKTTVTVTSSTAAATSSDTETVLTVIKDAQTVTYTMNSLKALPQISGYAGQMSSTGNISGPFQYKGIAMSEILKAVGGISETNAVRISAKDGYSMTLSYKQMTEGNFTVLDSSTGKETAATNKPVVFLAYEEDGKTLGDLGPLRMGIMTSNSQVTEGHWWVKWSQKIEVIPVQAPWNLKLDGAIVENMDQNTFESGAAIGCHGVKYTDDSGQAWEGIPLFLLLGRVDDVTDTHKGDAFSDAVADTGYEVQIIAVDGYTAKFTSAETKRNNNMIVAYKLNGKPLTDKAWPLKLVGSAVDKKRQIGGIASIKLVFGGSTAAATTTTAVPEGPVVLTVTKGTQTKTFSMAQLKALTPLTGFAGQKNKAGVIAGPVAYSGVSLLEALKAVGGIKDGDTVKVTAKDGYSKSLTYTQITVADFPTYDTTGNPVAAEMKPAVFLAYEKEGAALDEATGPIQMGIMTCKNQVTDGSWWVKLIEKVDVTSP